MTTPRAARRKWLSRLIRYGFLLVVVVFAIVAVSDQYSSVAHGIERLSVGSIVGSFGAVSVSLWLSMLSWRRVLADLGSPLPLRAAARIYFVGQLGKYLPGSVWPVLAQMELARDYDVPRPRTAAAAIVAIGLGLVATLIVAGALLPFAVPSTGWRLLVITGLVVSLVVASPPVLNRLLAWGLRVLRRPPMETPLTPRGLTVATLYAVGGWVAQGFGLYALTLSLGSGARLLPLSIGSYAAASALGIVVLIAPAGLGVREPALVAALGGRLGTGGALVAALTFRLIVSVADLGTGALLAALPKERSVRRDSEQAAAAELAPESHAGEVVAKAPGRRDG
jgi:glycosyltransferase 2 family protein